MNTRMEARPVDAERDPDSLLTRVAPNAVSPRAISSHIQGEANGTLLASESPSFRLPLSRSERALRNSNSSRHIPTTLFIYPELASPSKPGLNTKYLGRELSSTSLRKARTGGQSQVSGVALNLRPRASVCHTFSLHPNLNVNEVNIRNFSTPHKKPLR